MAPGPEVARQTPTSPVNLACAQAMNAAISSCRTWIKSILSWSAVKRAHDPIDAIARKSKDAFDAPFQQPVDEKIGDVLFHGGLR